MVVAQHFLGGGQGGRIGERPGEQARQRRAGKRLPGGDPHRHRGAQQQHCDAKEIVAIPLLAERVDEGGAELNADAVDEQDEADRGDDGGQRDIRSQCARRQPREQHAGDAQPETEDAHLAQQVADSDDGEQRDYRELSEERVQGFFRQTSILAGGILLFPPVE